VSSRRSRPTGEAQVKHLAAVRCRALRPQFPPLSVRKILSRVAIGLSTQLAALVHNERIRGRDKVTPRAKRGLLR
jgi:hypothetical protein